MSIRKGLLIYRAPRHQENRLIDIKYGFYSSKASLSTTTKQFQGNKIVYQKHSKNFVRKMNLRLDALTMKDVYVIKHFSNLKGVQEVVIWTFLFFLDPPKSSEPLATKIIQRVFRTLKQIKHVTMKTLGPLQKNPKILKNILLLKDLRSLTQIDFYYSEDPRDFEPLLQVFKSAFRRKSWPHFNSLVVDPFYPKESFRDPDANNPVESLNNLLRFLRGFKACERFYQHSRFQFRFPQSQRASLEETSTIKKISKIVPPKSLEKIFLRPLHLLQGKIDYNKAPESFQSLYLEMNADNKENLPFYFGILIQIQSMINLTSLSIEFHGKHVLTDELSLDICHVLSSLHKLKNLSFLFLDCTTFGGERSRLLKRPWLEDAFKAIGKRKMMQNMTLYFPNFDFENSDRMFNTLCLSLGKLVQLSSLYFEITYAHSIGDQAVITLVDSLKRLKKMESLTVVIRKRNSNFRSSTFLYLMDCMRNSFPLLSNLHVTFERFQVTRQCYQCIYETIHQMKSLSHLSIRVGGKLDEGLDMRVLEKEYSKKFTGWIHGNFA